MPTSLLEKINKAKNLSWWLDSFYYAKAIAIDIRSECVNILYMDKNIGGVRLLDKQLIDTDIIPHYLPQTENLPPKEAEGKFLSEFQEFIKKNKPNKGTEIVLSLPRKLLTCKFIDIPSPDEASIKNILSFDLERHIPIAKENIYYDFEVIGKKNDAMYHVMLVAVQKKIVDYYLTLLKKISIKPSIIYMSSLGCLNLYQFCSSLDSTPAIIVDLDKNNMELCVVKDGALYESKNYSTLNKSVDWIESFFQFNDHTLTKKCGDFIVGECNKILPSLNLTESKDNPVTIVFPNEDPKWQNVSQYIDENKGIKTFTLAPTQKIKKNTTLLKNEETTLVANTLGVGLRGVSSLFSNINLTPGVQNKKFKKKGIMITLLLLSLFIVTLLTSLFSGYIKDKITLNKLNAELTQLKKKITDIEGLGIKSEQLEKQILNFSQIQKSTVSKLKVIKELSTIIPSSVWITNFKIANRDLEISGFAQTASELIKIMEDSPLFNDVHFLGTIKKESSKEKFKISAALP